MERKTYKMKIAGLDRELPLCPLNEKLQIGAFVIFGDPELTTASGAAAPRARVRLRHHCRGQGHPAGPRDGKARRKPQVLPREEGGKALHDRRLRVQGALDHDRPRTGALSRQGGRRADEGQEDTYRRRRGLDGRIAARDRRARKSRRRHHLRQDDHPRRRRRRLARRPRLPRKAPAFRQRRQPDRLT